MIADESLHGTAHDTTQAHAFQGRRCCELPLVVESHATRDMQFGRRRQGFLQTGVVIIGLDILPDKLAEMVDDQCFHLLQMEMPVDERGEAGEKTVGKEFPVNALDNCVQRESRLGHKLLTQFVGQLAFEQGIQETDAQDRPTALISKDIAQCRCVGHYPLSVIETGVRSRSEDAGDTSAVLAKSSGSPDKVALHRDVCLCSQQAPEGLFYPLFGSRGSTTAIEPKGLRPCGLQLPEVGCYFLFENGGNLLFRLVTGVDTLC